MVKQLTIKQLNERLDKKESLPAVLDVREPWELDACTPGDTHNIPMGQFQNRIEELNKDRDRDTSYKNNL